MAQVHQFLTEIPSFPGFLKIRLLAITRGLPPSGPRMLRLRLAQKATRLPTRSSVLSAFHQRSISGPVLISGPALSAVENEEGQRYPRWPSWRCSLASGHPCGMPRRAVLSSTV